MSKQVRTSITLPPELKARMDHFDVNWSEVARRTFARKVDDMEQAAKTSNIEPAVFERLQASRERAHDSAKRQGFSDGADWAKHDAEYEHLEALRAVRDWESCPHDEEPAWSVSMAIWGDVDEAREKHAQIWGEDEAQSEAYVIAFIAGALEVLDAFEAALE